MVAVSFSGNTDWRRQGMGMGMGMGIGGVRKECGDDNVASVRDVARGRPGPRRDSGIVGAAETATVLNVLKERERGPQNSPWFRKKNWKYGSNAAAATARYACGRH